MLRVNKKMEYGILALLHLSAEPGKVASVREIASHCHIPEALLSKVMQRMKSAGIVKVTHGNHGGYQLDRQLATISLLDMSDVLVGPVQLTECLEPGNSGCPAIVGCRLATPMSMLNQKLIELFQATSLESIATQRIAV